MSSGWIISGLLVIAFLILINLTGPLKGSGNSDFPEEYQPNGSNPLPACPESPNCIRLSISYSISPSSLFPAIRTILEEMGASEIEQDSQSFQFKTVFKIPPFGFRDDFTIKLSDNDDTDGTELHLLSQSRKGYGDLGVNRRRVSTFLNSLESNL